MPDFHLLLHGKGLQLLDQHGSRRRGGVYVWRLVNAIDAARALEMARDVVLADPEFREEIWNDSVDELVFEVEELFEMPRGERCGDSGLVFYIDDDE